MRVLISIIAIMVFFGSVVGSRGADYIFNDAEGIFVRILEQSCYNYTFLDENSIPDNVLYDTELNLCRDNRKVLKAVLNKTGSAGGQNEESEQLPKVPSLLPNPEIGFFEEGSVNYSDYEIFRARDTIFYGGVLPFVAIPDDDLANEDTFFNEDSISLFLYFKRKF